MHLRPLGLPEQLKFYGAKSRHLGSTGAYISGRPSPRGIELAPVTTTDREDSFDSPEGDFQPTARTAPGSSVSGASCLARRADRADQISLLLKVRHDSIHDLWQGGPGPEAGEILQLFQRRHPPMHILEARLVGLVIGDISYRRRTPSPLFDQADRKSTRLNSSHSQISYAVF